jgi:dihydroxyacetone kinase
MAQSAGKENVELVVVGDDVSVPHSRGKMVGRRCLAGITLGECLIFLSSNLSSVSRSAPIIQQSIVSVM